ncbi:UNVERIFIED_CONTAM: hypothetical protein GTU68_002591 [Idotea baltica]|nr:hypothetical protein [Idotea baltica]
MKIENTVAVISGAGSGMGRALCIQLAKRCKGLAISDINPESLAETVQMIKAEHSNVEILHEKIDVADRNAVHQYADNVYAHFGQVDIVINNAGVAIGKASLEELDYDSFEWLMNINTWGMIYGTKAFWPYLKKQKTACVVNLSSLFGLIGVGHQIAYCTSKFAIRGFTESLRMEVAQTAPGINVMSVHPGGVKTNIANNSTWITNISDEQKEKHVKSFEKSFITTAESAASTIINGIIKNKKRVLVGRDAKLVDLINRILPALYTNILGRILNKRHEKRVEKH